MDFFAVQRRELVTNPAARRAVAELTHECLTVPYDQEALRCMVVTRSRARCLGMLQRRLGRPIAREELTARCIDMRRAAGGNDSVGKRCGS